MPRPAGSPNKSTLARLRAEYLRVWSRSWPHDDGLLADFWRESGAVFLGNPVSGRPDPRVEWVLERMREDHEFDPAVPAGE